MKALITRSLLLFTLAATAGTVNADDRYDNRYRAPAFDRIEWRLGASRGAYGHQILFRAPGSRGWQIAPGSATALGNGWVLGTDRHTGGYGIYRWNGYNWSRMPGAAVRIGGSYQQPWVINDRNIRYVWNGYSWRQDGYTAGRDDRDNRFGNNRNDWQNGFDRRDDDRNQRDGRGENRDRDSRTDRDNRDNDWRNDRDDRNYRRN